MLFSHSRAPMKVGRDFLVNVEAEMNIVAECFRDTRCWVCQGAKGSLFCICRGEAEEGM